MPGNPIQTPASYTASHAIAFASPDGTAMVVSAQAPLPTAPVRAATTPLAGTAVASSVQGPFQPVPDRPLMLSLSGTWTGTVRVLRSTDGGATKLPLTIGGAAWGQYTGNCCEPVWEESDASAQLYLDITLTGGTVAYRIAQ